MVEVSKESHEVVDAIVLRLSPDKAKEVYGLLAGVSVNYSTDTFDDIAEQIGVQFDGFLPVYEVDEWGEFGPEKLVGVQESSGDCGCSAFSDVDLFDIDPEDTELAEGL